MASQGKMRYLLFHRIRDTTVTSDVWPDSGAGVGQGFGELIGRHLTDSRPGKNTRFPMADVVR
jgi:hypothetical protein